MLLKNIPILRIFDVAKAKEFYIDWLGFTIEWEHQFEENMPYYICVSKDDIQLHLSEHHGDATPGGKVFIVCNEIEKYYAALQSRPYKYYRPGLEKTFYGATEFSIADNNNYMITFAEDE